MDPSAPTHDQTLLEELRLRRAELRGSMSALEHALAAPAPRDQARWAERVEVALVELTADFREHVDVTEGPEGLYAEVLATAPRLSGVTARLAGEHTKIRALIDDLMARVGALEAHEDVEQVRELGTALIVMLVRHRQRGADLVYDAYEFDIGGET
ncbi:MAG: hypothetical protein ACXVW9_18815 [Nocardioidaceae bacterium]